MKTSVVKKDAIMLEDHNEVNKAIGHWYDMPIYKDTMTKYMTEWLITCLYEVDESSHNLHIYFNYALNKNLVIIINGHGVKYKVELTKHGREWLDEQRS